MRSIFKIGTRESELAVWQATQVKELLADKGHEAALVFIKSEGDVDLQTPLYEMGVQGIFTRSLDIALLNGAIDIAVHSMKDVPTQLPAGLAQAAVLKRGNYKDLFVMNSSHSSIINDENVGQKTEFTGLLDSLKSDEVLPLTLRHTAFTIATSSTRRRAQWLHRYPHHIIENLRGNVNTRMRKLAESSWQGAIFAAAGLERISLRPKDSIELDWMLPAPAQGAIMLAARSSDEPVLEVCNKLNDESTATCTRIEKDFLRQLLGGCTTPISALAQFDKKDIYFRGSILSLDGKEKIEIEKYVAIDNIKGFGSRMAIELLNNGGREIADNIRDAK